jgi:CHASE3 domain sensor protein
VLKSKGFLCTDKDNYLKCYYRIGVTIQNFLSKVKNIYKKHKKNKNTRETVKKLRHKKGTEEMNA